MTANLDDIAVAELRALIRDVLREVLPATKERDAEPLAGSSGPPVTTLSALTTPPPGVPAGQPGAGGQPAEVAAEPAATQPAPATRLPATRAQPTASGPRAVRLETDADLRKFALDILRLAENPARRRDLLAGRLTFTLAGRARETAPGNDHRIETGAVTERAVQSAAKAGQRLVLGRRAVLTPLARDRALALGVPIEKER